MELSNFIVEAVLKQAVTDKIVVYGGRFQPFHKGHKKVYDALVSKFGSKNVYIATSDVQDGDKSPLSFSDKKEIATKLFGIPSSKFVKVKQPYQPVEILRGYDDTTTALIVAVGEKDDARLGGNYFKPYTNDKNLKGYGANAYVFSQLPSNSFGATDVRNMFRNNRMGGERKQKEFEKFFGKFDKAIYTKLITKLNEGIDTDNNIPGGKADDLTLVDIAKKWAGDYYDYKNVLDTVKQELKRGIKIELEHTSDIKIAAEIAKDHLAEKLTYYRDLHNIEKGMYQPHNPIKEASAAGSGYDEKTLDQLVDNPETGEKVKVRSALNYDKNHPAYRAAMAIVGKSGAQKPNQKQRPNLKPQQPQNRNAGGPMTGANNRVGAKPTPGANNQNGTNSTNKTQKPLEKPLTNPAQAQEKPQQSQPQQTVSVDKVRKEIPNFKVSDKSDIGKVSVKQRREVSMKIDDLAKKSAEAKANGEKAPNFNLCDITIPGTNLYCGGNKGIPREQMPQFKGKPQPGSIADGLPKDKDGEVDTEAMFKKMLEDKGIKVSEPTQVPADQLKATQTELVGPKVAGMSKALDTDPNHPGITAPIYVSSDGYVLDGHHRWAAITSHEIVSGREAMMNVRVIDMPIDQLVKESNEFAQKIGVQAKTADTNKENDTESKTKKFKGTTSGKEIQTIEIDGGGQVYGTVHKNTAMVDDIINDVKSKIPKEKWKDIVFVGEGGATNKLGELEFHDEMKYAVPKFKEMGASIDTFDGDDLDVHKPDSLLYKKQIEKTGLNQSQVNAGNWASMIGQGEGTDTMKPTTFLDESGKQFLQDAAKEAGFPPIENWDNPTDKDKDTLYRLSFPEDNGDKETKINDIQVAFNEIRDESIIEKSKSLSAQGKIPITIAGEGHIDLVDKKIKKSTEKSSTGLASTSSKEKNAKGAGIGKVTTKAVQNPEIVKRAIKSKIQKWSDKEKKFFRNGEHKANSPLRSNIGKTLNNTMQNLVPSIKQEMEHLGHTYQFAGEGLASLFDGKVVSDKGKDAIKKMAQVLSISSIKSIDNKDKHSKALMQHLGKHLAAHIADDIITNGVGKVAQNAGVEIDGDNDKFVEWFGLYFAQQMKDGKIPLDVWESTVQDYMKDSEDGKVDGDTNTVAEVIIEVDEDINVDVDKGDVVLTGKFKNKKTVVKDISKDQHGMPTINGRQATTFRKVEEGIINEGGAYGHMNHPFDVRMNLSFGDLKAIVNNALDGNLGVVREKTDGQALAISWKNGRLISARNKGHLANAGANAMDINGVASKFGGRGGLTDAYNFAMKDLENAIRGLSKAQKDKIFKEGKVFVNLEVIWPTSVNVIPYNQALLVFHNAVEYNEAGNPISKIDGAESILGGMIKQINAHVQSKYTIQGPPIVKLPKTKQLSSQKGKFKGMISKLQSEFGLTDKDGVADYHQAWWENFVDNSKKKISALEKAGLVKRWAFDNKSMRIGDIKDDKAREWAEGIDKGPKTTIMSGNLRKFEDIFLGVGAEVLSFMGSVLTAQPDKALQSMRAELESTASQIMNGGTITQIKKLEKELSRLNSIGGFDKIVPSEGIVFSYKGNAYKLTGAFAPLNQILGIFKFSR